MKRYSKQRARVLRHLQDHITINPMQAIKHYGVMRLAAVIHDLRKEGYDIITHTVNGHNRYGEPTHYAKYELRTEQTRSDWMRTRGAA